MRGEHRKRRKGRINYMYLSVKGERSILFQRWGSEVRSLHVLHTLLQATRPATPTLLNICWRNFFKSSIKIFKK